MIKEDISLNYIENHNIEFNSNINLAGNIKQTTGSLYFWAAHLAGPRWGPFASWCCAWLETMGLISGIGAQVLPLFSSTSSSVSFLFLIFLK
jgi:amino acid transporter